MWHNGGNANGDWSTASHRSIDRVVHGYDDWPTVVPARNGKLTLWDCASNVSILALDLTGLSPFGLVFFRPVVLRFGWGVLWMGSSSAERGLLFELGTVILDNEAPRNKDQNFASKASAIKSF